MTIFVILNNKRYIFCYCIFNYDDNCIFDLYVSYMSFIITFIINNESVIYCNFCYIIPNQSKNGTKSHFQFWSTSQLENYQFPLHLSSEHHTAEQYHKSANHGGIELNTVLHRRLEANYVNTLLYPLSVSDCPIPGCGALFILIGKLTSKSALLLFTLLIASKTNFKKRPVIGNRIKCS